MELNKSLMAIAQQHEEAQTVALLNESAEFRGDMDSSFGSDLHSVSFQEISTILRAKPDINIFYRTPCSGSNRFSRRSSSARTPTDFFSKLPDVLLLRIFWQLNKRDLVSILLVCRRFEQIGKDHSLWEFMNLANQSLDEECVHTLLDRQLKVLRLASAPITGPSLFPWYDLSAMSPSRLTHLDLSQAKFSDHASLLRILKRCHSLQALSLESCELIDDDCCRAISKNTDLRFLDLVYAKHLSTVGISSILCKCRRLLELNLAWAEVENDAIPVICQFLTATMLKLNLSGFRNLPSVNDENIARLCVACPALDELDLSDNALITELALEYICSRLRRLRVLTLSRCYGIEPMALLQLGHLRVLNVYGCITNDGVELLQHRLDPTLINASPYSTVAKPTVGDSVTSIWRQRTRDLY